MAPWSRGPELHFALETLAYLVGGRLYWRAASGMPRPAGGDRWILIGSAILGAALGSKLLHVFEHLPALRASADPALWLAGKSVLGGFLGGLVATECAKLSIGWRVPTGDAWVPALVAGLLIGRLGCQLSGTWDTTYGSPTELPWGWNYGDGIMRHPVGFYEMILAAVAGAVALGARWRAAPGAAFAIFMLLYCGIRFGLEFLKPPFGLPARDALPVALYGPFTAIQWAAVAGLAWCGALLQRRMAAAGGA